MRRLSLLLTVVLTLLVGAPPAAAAPALPTVVGSAGDSITRAYDATLVGCVLIDCPRYSWATGTSGAVSSHLSRLRGLQPGTTVTATNAAQTGARMAALEAQLDRLPANVQYVTVLIGANDLCTSGPATMTPVETFRAQFERALTSFYADHLDAVVFVSSIPDLHQLYTLLRGNRIATTTWRTFGICPSMLSATATDAQRAAVVEREQAFNTVLAEVCATHGDRCDWDDLATYRYPFTARDVSTVDYFHPSIAGQASLAGITWAAGFWGTPH